MNFTHYQFNNLKRGQTIEVTLKGSAANVRLMSSSGFQSYKSGRRHSYRGGLAKSSPVRLTVPSAGNWHVTVDMQGLRGSVQTSARALPGTLPTLQERPLREVPSLLRPEVETTGEYDVFISHASEDKDEIARPLAEALRDLGMRVWYDEFELKLGDSLRRKIDQGLARSRFGILVLSQAFTKKGWTNYELDGIITKVVSGEQTILPIWHNITKQQVIEYSPSLADKVARSTGSHTPIEIAEEIAELIKSKTNE